jgi:hypothetical protein
MKKNVEPLKGSLGHSEERFCSDNSKTALPCTLGEAVVVNFVNHRTQRVQEREGCNLF